jgi:hypothetical protein
VKDRFYAIVLQPDKIPVMKRIPEDFERQAQSIEELKRVYPNGLIGAIQVTQDNAWAFSPTEIKHLLSIAKLNQ